MMTIYDICKIDKIAILARYSKKKAGFNFCDIILPYHNYEWTKI